MRNTSSGFLNVTINNKKETNPIPGAKVTITEHKNRDKIIKSIDTNAAGQTDLIELEGPNPTDSSDLYKKYDMIIQIPPAEGIEQGKTYVKSGIQIKNNEITNSQDEISYIIALEKAMGERRVLEIDIPDNYQTQVFKEYQNPYTIPDKIKQEDGMYLHLLPEYVKPFVPNEIDIYLGKASPYIKEPVNKNKIITEDYIKYVKMVAAKEIGGIRDLKDQAAIAIVLSINSYALNRLYTEIYKNAGYNFNITNSTQFDQDYRPGFNTFEKIDKIVDKYFDKFIQIEGKVQPFLTPHCSGNQICPFGGIPQNGANKLAKENPSWTYLDILKHYFNKSDIKIKITEAEQVENIPKSYPGYPLKLSITEDAAVKEMQIWLNVIRKNYNSIPILQENGIFDENTFKAVIAFQKLFEKNKSEKGIVDEVTWNKISHKYVIATKIAEPTGNRFAPPQPNYQTYVEWVPVMMPVYVPMYRFYNKAHRHRN